MVLQKNNNNYTCLPGIVKTVSFVGAGNVATHLALALYKAGFKVSGIYSRTRISASELAEKVGSRVCTDIAEVCQNSQLVIVSVPDHAFSALLKLQVPDDVIIIHTCGTVEMTVFKNNAAHYGVLYPLQTFSQKVALDLKNVPVCIEASDNNTLDAIRLVASSFSDNVVEISSEKRKILHLAAVFACNFPNAMYAMADDILKTTGLSFSLLHPLIIETARKATLDQPWNVQTGPARRNELTTIQTHEAMLKDIATYEEIYKLLSNTILMHYKEKENQDNKFLNGDKEDIYE